MCVIKIAMKTSGMKNENLGLLSYCLMQIFFFWGLVLTAPQWICTEQIAIKYYNKVQILNSNYLMSAGQSGPT